MYFFSGWRDLEALHEAICKDCGKGAHGLFRCAEERFSKSCQRWVYCKYFVLFSNLMNGYLFYRSKEKYWTVSTAVGLFISNDCCKNYLAPFISIDCCKNYLVISIPVWVYIFDGHWEISIPIITWLTLTGIQFPNGPWFTGMEISPKMGRKALPLWAYGPWEASFFSRGLIFGGEEILIPETRPIRKSYISNDSCKNYFLLFISNDFCKNDLVQLFK